MGARSGGRGPQALPDGRIARLADRGHAADLLAPDVVAAPLLAFLHGSG